VTNSVPTSVEVSALPQSWIACRLSDVVDYGATRKVEPNAIPADAWVLELEDIEKDTSRVLQRLTFGQRQSKSTKNHFAAGDVLYGKLRPYLNKVIRADEGGFCTTEIVPLAPPEWFEGRYLYFWLKHPRFLEYVTAVSHGLNMPRLGTDAGRDAPFVLAPIKEQARISDKLDAVLARVDACRERLDRVLAILKRFRKSVLAAATSGRLTDDWRADRVTQSKQEVDLAEPPLLDHLRIPVTKSKRSSGQRLYPYYGANGQVDSVDEFLFDDDLVLVTEDETFYGREKPIAYRVAGRCWVNNHAHVLRPSARLEADYLCCCLMYYDVLPWLTGTTGRAKLTQAVLNALPIAVPPSDELTEIIRRVESLFAYADRLEASYKAARAQVDRLTPALLAKAFRGELVPQDPNDEPASLLLERIRAGRAAEPAKTRQRKGGGAANKARKGIAPG
jgi:type I restriction enzyme S subunit